MDTDRASFFFAFIFNVKNGLRTPRSCGSFLPSPEEYKKNWTFSGDGFKNYFYGPLCLTVTCWCLSRLRSTGMWTLRDTTSGGVFRIQYFCLVRQWIQIRVSLRSRLGYVTRFLRKGGPHILRCLRSVLRQAHDDLSALHPPGR